MRIITLVACMAGLFMIAANPHAEPQTVVVEIKSFKFNPAEITIKPGTTVRWENREFRQFHNVWFEQSGEPQPDYIFPEESYQRQFNEAGEFPYRCGPHPQMTGVVRVAP